MSNAGLIEKFYSSFAAADAEAMASCYHPGIVFTDPAFGKLKGDEVKNMWRMLIERSGGKLHISFSNVTADDKFGSATWKAEYIFSQTGRKVINNIQSQFEFGNGLIIRQSDHFDLWKWTRQALGVKGYLLGWTSFMQNKIQQGARKSLENYNNKQTVIRQTGGTQRDTLHNAE